MDKISKIFKTSLLNKILPYWPGTEWSFEGHSSIPQKGTIACGYFVSTTLKDVGLNLNRYKFAQQRPIYEAKSLALNTEVMEISEESTSENIIAIREQTPEGIHFIGFDENHVGFILKQEKELYLIHSNYIGGKGVELEEIEESKVFQSYDKFYIAELSTNEELLRHWVNNKNIKILTE